MVDKDEMQEWVEQDRQFLNQINGEDWLGAYRTFQERPEVIMWSSLMDIRCVYYGLKKEGYVDSAEKFKEGVYTAFNENCFSPLTQMIEGFFASEAKRSLTDRILTLDEELRGLDKKKD